MYFKCLDDYDIRYYLESRKDFKCPPFKYDRLVSQTKDGKIQLSMAANSTYYRCYYRQLSGCLSPNQNLVTFKGHWTKIKHKIEVKADQFVVKCIDYHTNSTIFEDVFANIIDKPIEKIKKATKEKLNVILLILDSVSNTQFQRHMPKTLKFFEQQKAAIMKAHSMVSFNNIVTHFKQFLI